MKKIKSLKIDQSGVTLIELLITVAVLGILISLAVPSFTSTIERRRLEGAAEELYSYLQFARSESIKRATDVRVYFTNTAGADWCYGLKVNATCDCTETDSTQSDYCEIDGVKKIVNQDDHQGITINGSSQPFSGWFAFDNRRGTAESGGVTFINSYEIRVAVSTLGRIRVCGNNDTALPDLIAYDAC